MRRRSPKGLSHTLEVEEQLTSPSEGAQGENVPYGDAVGERRRAGLQLLRHRSLVSFTGLVTFKSFQGAESVRAVPAGRYMLETDGPYMAPVPHRGERNEPAFLPAIRDHVALLRGTTPDDVERETTEAARVIFRLPTGEA